MPQHAHARHFLFTLLLVMGFSQVVTPPVGATENNQMTAYDFSFDAIDGGDLPLAQFKGKTILVVNTASQCGFTKQYTELQQVWETYRDKGLVVLGVPSNDFGGQEPGSETQIKEFCEVNFSVDFPLTGKTKVKGSDAHPFYEWAGKQFSAMAKPRWNFHKYLIGPDGQLADWFSTPTNPMSGKVRQAIERELAKALSAS